MKAETSKTAWRSLLIFLSLLLFTDLHGEERKARTGIAVVPVGKIDRRIIDVLKNDLNRAFNREVFIGKEMVEPSYAFNRTRNQCRSTAILDAVADENEFSTYEKVLGIVDHDLFVPELNFVFGEASRRVAIISLIRLRQEFYNQPENRDLLHRRVLTEAVHELGHTYGLGHCGNPQCVMFFSNTLMDTDRKGAEFCPRCKSNLPSPHRSK